MVHVRNLDQNQSIFALSERSSGLLDLGGSDQNWSSSKRLCWLLKPVGISRKLQKFPLPLVFVFYKFFLISGVKKFRKKFLRFFSKIFFALFLPVFCAKKNKKNIPYYVGGIFFFYLFRRAGLIFYPEKFFHWIFFEKIFFGFFHCGISGNFWTDYANGICWKLFMRGADIWVAWSFCHGAGVAENRQGHCGLGAAGMMPEFAGIYVQSVNIETRNTCGTMSFVQLFCIKA